MIRANYRPISCNIKDILISLSSKLQDLPTSKESFHDHMRVCVPCYSAIKENKFNLSKLENVLARRRFNRQLQNEKKENKTSKCKETKFLKSLKENNPGRVSPRLNSKKIKKKNNHFAILEN